MKLIIGSENPVKVGALKEVIKDYDLLKNSKIYTKNVSSGVSEQPSSLEETIEGAINRSKNSYDSDILRRFDYSFGIESGLIYIPRTKSGKMDVCFCSIYDGKNIILGMSRCFELPIDSMRIIKKEGKTLNDAFYELGITDNPKIGSDEGASGILTKGRVTRKDYTKDAIQMALIQIENKELY
jgi:inosine/xanthosine triphosphatase